MPRSSAPRKRLATSLLDTFAHWCREPLARHLLAVALLILVLAIRFWRYVFEAHPQNDEAIYFRAFQAVADGFSPFTSSGYLTSSFFAYAGAWCVEHLGRLPTLALLRFGNLTGVAVAAWFSLAWVRWSWRRRLATAALFVALAPMVRFGVVLGNLSCLLSGMLIAGLLLWPRAPRSSGVLLGTSVVLKPVAFAAIIALFSHRPSPATKRHLVAAGVAAGIATAILVGSPHLGEFLSIDDWDRLARSVSPHRFAYLLGLRGSVPLVSVAIILVTLAVVRWRLLGPTQCYAVGVTAAIAATPLVWSHTLLATLPLQALALLVLYDRSIQAGRSSTASDSPDRRQLRWETVLVALAVVAIQASEGATNIYDQHLLIQWIGSIPPAIAPAALTAYLLHHTSPF